MITKASLPQHLLIVDDAPSQLRTLCDIFTDEGFAVCPCATLNEVLEHCRRGTFDIVVVDLHLRECDGIELLKRVQELQPQIRTVIHTGYGSFESAKNAIDLGAFAYVEKSSDPAELVSKVHRAAKDVLSEALTESENHFQSLLNDIDVIVWEATLPDHQLNYVSQQLEVMLGYPVAQWLENPEAREDAIHANDRDRAVNHCRECAERGEDYELEFRVVTADGRIVWLHDVVHVIKDAASRPSKLRGVMFDVTEKKNTEIALRNSESLFRTIFEQAAVGVALIETHVGRFVRINQKYSELIGYSNEEMTRLTFKDITYPDDLDEDLANMKKLHVGEIDEFGMEKRLIRKDGTPIWVNLTVSPTWQLGERPGFHIAVVEDISRSKMAEESLRNSEARFRALVENSYDVINMFNSAGEPIYTSPSVERVLGYKPDELKEITPVELIHPGDFEEAVTGFHQYVDKPGAVGQLKHRLRHKDGGYRTVEVTGMNLLHETGVNAMVSIFRDVTEREEAEQALRTSEDRYRSVVAALSEGVALYDRELNLLAHNESAERILGLTKSQLMDRSLVDDRWRMVREDDSKLAVDEYPATVTLRTAKSLSNQVMGVQRPDGELIWISVNTRPLFHEEQLQPYAVLTSFEDISERKRAQQQLRFRRFAIEHADEAMFTINAEGQFVDVNETACQRLKYSRSELLDLSVAGINPHYPIEQWPDHWNELKRKGKVTFESEHMAKDGRVFPVEISKSYIEFEGHEYAFAFVRDISQRMLAQSQLRITQYAIDRSQTAFSRIDHTGRMQYVNDAACQNLGYSREEFLSMYVWDIDSHWTAEDFRERWKNLKKAVSSTFESVHQRKDGTTFPVDISANYVEFDGEEFIFAYASDISERVRAQQLLVDSEARYRTLVENAPEAILVLDVEVNRFVDFNEKALRLFCVDREGMSECGPVDFSPPNQPDGRASDIAAMEQVDRSLAGEALSFEWTHRDANGRVFDAEVRLVRLPACDKSLLRASVTDISERKLTEQRLRESEAKFRALCERSSALVAILQDGRYRYANPATVAVTGYSAEELADLDFMEIVHPQFRDLVAERHIKRQRGEDVPSRYEFKIVTKKGRERWVDIAAEVIEYEGWPAVLATCVDVTQRKIAEEQLRERETQLAHMSRVTAMGEMASALAHELTQPLGAAANYAGGCIDLIEKRQSSPELLAATLKKLNEQVLRSGKIIGQLKSFVSQSRPNRGRLIVHDLIREVEQLLAGHLSKHRLKLRLDFDCEMREIYADKIQIEQVLVNLVGNAIEAMLDVTSVQKEIVIHGSVVDGVPTVTVRDSGSGIEESEVDRLFEPYFTTKPDGMGMGLSICRTIINNHGGRLWATRNEEGGASFHFTLSCAAKEVSRDDERSEQTNPVL